MQHVCKDKRPLAASHSVHTAVSPCTRRTLFSTVLFSRFDQFPEGERARVESSVTTGDLSQVGLLSFQSLLLRFGPSVLRLKYNLILFQVHLGLNFSLTS